MKVIDILNTRFILITLLTSVLLTFTACDDEQPENERSLDIEFEWDISKPDLPPDFIGAGDDDSTKIDIKKISVWFHPFDSSQATEYSFSSHQELKKYQFDLPAGEYRMFTSVNLLPPYIDEYNPTLSRAFTDGERHFITLEKPNLSPEPAYCYESKVVVTESGVQKVNVKMKEILAEMTFIINGVPRGTIFNGSVENATAGIIPKFDEKINEMVAVCSEQIMQVELPAIVSSTGILNIKDFRLLPSVNGATETLINIKLIYPNTMYSDFEIHAPEMCMGGKYYIALDFADMTPIMYLKSVKIDDWTAEWTINGEILNPEN